MSVLQQRFNRFVRPLTDRLLSRGQKKGDDQSSSGSAPAPLIFETLEPRLLLAADPWVSPLVMHSTSLRDYGGRCVRPRHHRDTHKWPHFHARNRQRHTLDGINDYVNLGNPAALQFTGSMTVSAWVHAIGVPGRRRGGRVQAHLGYIGYQLDITKDTGPRTIGFKLTNSSGGPMFRYGATALQPNTWYYVTGVYDAVNQTLNVYLNGSAR